MVLETLKTNTSHINNYRSTNCKTLAFDLPSLIANMKQSYKWLSGELKAMILLKNSERQVILTAMHPGTEIESFQANDSVTFEIIEGTLKFHIRKDKITLKKGQLMTLDEKIKYQLTTSEETVFLLTISNGISRAASQQA